MKKSIKYLSVLLAVLLLLPVIPFSASAAVDREAEIKSLYLTTAYNTPEEKLASMTLMLEANGHRLYVDPVSGEVACEEIATGAILFSNPYDVATCGGSDDNKMRLLSQIAVKYVDNGIPGTLYSFKEAAMREQISVLRIKSGVRIEYVLGREETRKLVPRWITDESFQKYILEPMKASVEDGSMDRADYTRFTSFYKTKVDMNDPANELLKNRWRNLYFNSDQWKNVADEDLPVIWVIDDKGISTLDLNRLESWIKAYCPEYTFEQMDADHDYLGYVATDEKFPAFKLALEYSLTDHGMTVRLPCNGLRYDMASYTLESISILPYLGAGNSLNASKTDDLVDYNFYPDGSGALFDFADLSAGSELTVRGKVYGIDFAYNEIAGRANQKVIRTPVYGTVSSEKIYDYHYVTKTGQAETLSVSATVKSKATVLSELANQGATLQGEPTLRSYQRGYFAVIEAGDTLSEIETYHAGTSSRYNSMINYFNPKPKDSYSIDALSVSGGTSTITKVSNRKYTGNILIRYTMLNDVAQGETAREKDPAYIYYQADWLGMAEAYRDLLESTGVLTRLSSETLKKDIPLYIDVFGTVETQKSILTIPVKVKTPLTTTDDILTMYETLSKAGVGNINFKMTGFANGGIYSTLPSKLKWEKSIGGKKGINSLIAKANEINSSGSGEYLGLYPDFDFAYVMRDKLFDDTNLKKDAVRTVDNRYTSYRQYSATLQTYVSFWQLAISPSRYSKFYTKLLKNYQPYGLDTMSVSTLGNALNSDFDEEDPYNREDGKVYTQKALEDMKNAGYHLMEEGGNSYTWSYVDHILDLPLDSSRYVKSSASIPFLGVVLHGCVQFAGPYLNEEGDTDYALLRAIENGAGMSFLLSYRNTDILKEDSYLSQYYSVRYDIWEEDVIELYNELNGLLSDVQDKLIIGHEFLVSDRVLDADELDQKIENDLLLAWLEEEAKSEKERTEQALAIANTWSDAQNLASDLRKILKRMTEYNEVIGSEQNQEALEEKLSLLATKEELKQALALLRLDETAGDDFGLVEEVEISSANVGELEAGLREAEKALTSLQKALELLLALDEVPELVKAHYSEKSSDFAARVEQIIAQASAILSKQTDDEKELSGEELELLGKLEAMTVAAAKIEGLINDKLEAESFLVAFNNSLDAIGVFLSSIASDYLRVQALQVQAEAMVAQVEEGIAVITGSELDEEIKAKFRSLISTCLGDARSLLREASRLAGEKKAFLENTLIASAVAKGTDYARDAELAELCASHVPSKEKIFEAAKISEANDNASEIEEETALQEPDHRLVAVTYGTRDEKTHEKSAYKTFLLNYNDYAVVVEYGGRIYTVASGGYVVIKR